MSASKFQRLKRILWIMSLGSLLVFGISISTTFLESWVQLTYQNRHIILPYNVDSSYLEEIPIELISQFQLKEISSSFKDTKIMASRNTSSIEVKHLGTTNQGDLSYSIHSKGYISVQETLMEYYEWSIGDLLKIGNVIYPIQQVHYSEESDLKMPFSFIGNQTTKLNYDNILTIYSNQNINEIVSAINQSLVDSNYYYQLEPFSMDDLLMSLINLLRRILMAISMCIFLVSSSNIGTLMPYFIMEYQDEIEVLRLHGLAKEILANLFISFTILILLTSTLISSATTIAIFKLISFLTNIPLSLPIIKLLVLAFVQVSFATLLTLGSIKKAMDSIAYT